MAEPAANYQSVEFLSRVRKQAFKAWAVGLAVVFVWVLLIVITPLAKLMGLSNLSSSLYHFFSFACHQMPGRSFHIDGEQFAVCSRCFGVYFGLLTGFAVYPLWRNITDIEPLPRVWLFLSLIPITIDWALTMFGIWENTHASRFITGLILGFACATFIIPALVEVARRLWVPNPPRVAA
jgi:uncharacterized membrane protein